MKGHVKTVIGIALSVLLLAWALRDVSAAEVAREIHRANPALFVLAILISIGGFAFRAVRWGILLRPVAPHLAFHPRFAATIVGFAANNVLPARVGEVARAFSLSRLTRVPFGASFATLVVERLFDGFALVSLLFITLALPSFPHGGEIAGVDPRDAASAVAVVMAGAAVVLFLLVIAPGRSVRWFGAAFDRLLPARAADTLMRLLRGFMGGLVVLRDIRLFLVSFALAVGQWLFTALSFFVAFRAFGIDEVPFSGAVFLQSLISLAVAIPSSPGFFGPFEAAAKVGLGIWGVAPEKAISFAVGFHLGGFIPVTLMGIWYVWRLGLTWREVSHLDDTPPPPAIPAVARESS